MSGRVCFKLYREIYTNKEKTNIGVPRIIEYALQGISESESTKQKLLLPIKNNHSSCLQFLTVTTISTH